MDTTSEPTPGQHQLTRQDDGRWYCTRCTWSWQRRPADMSPGGDGHISCPGVPRWTWDGRPDYAKTKTELYAAGYRPNGGPIGCFYRASKNTKPDPWIWYYDARTAVPRSRRPLRSRV